MDNAVRNGEEKPDSLKKTLDLVEKSFEAQTKEANRKKNISLVFFVLLLPAVVLGDRLIASYLNSLVMKSDFRFSKIYNGTAEADILLVGNSRGHAFFQPEIRRLTGEKTFNFSHNAMPVSVARVFVEDYLDRYSAKKIVLEVSMLSKTEEAVVNSFKVYRGNSERLTKVIRQTSTLTDYSCMLSSLYCYNSEVFHRALYFLNHRDDNHIVEKEISENLLSNIHTIGTNDIEVTNDRMEDLKEIIKLAESKNIKVELVIGPYYPAYRNSIKNLSQFIDLVQKETGYKVKDYSALIKKNEYFSDYQHLNKKGSLIYIKNLKEDNVI